jgi:hypothetical protein
VKKYAKADDIASKHGGSDGSGSDDDAAFLSSSDDEDETPGGPFNLCFPSKDSQHSRICCRSANCMRPLLQVT